MNHPESITCEEDLDRAIQLVDELTSRELTKEEQAYLDMLSDLIEAYESNYPNVPVSNADMLFFLMEVRGIAIPELARETKIAENDLTRVLNGEPIKQEHAVILATFFHLDPKVFTP